ncbi:hypothetical protein JST97_21230 [bacterium]|nr:hypothetical protein [bacterium]
MRRLIIGLFLSGLGRAQPADLGREYQELRKQTGHFSGGGEWNEAVDQWKGRKHEVMARLGKLLENGERQSLLATMGEPDAREGNLWIYYWRGRHDYLYFVLQGPRIVRSGWWMAGE